MLHYIATLVHVHGASSVTPGDLHVRFPGVFDQRWLPPVLKRMADRGLLERGRRNNLFGQRSYRLPDHHELRGEEAA